MVQICCVDGCEDTKGDVLYFKFPNSRTLKRKWLDTFTPLGKVTVDSVVCSRHFLEDQYELVRGKKRLKAKVIPSIFNRSKNKSTEIESKSPKTDPSQDAKPEEIPVEKTAEENISIDNKLSEKDGESKTDSAIDKEDNDSIVRRTEPSETAIDTEINTERDIEEIITNYLIKQIRPLVTETETEIQDTGTEIDANIEIQEIRPDGETEIQRNSETEIQANIIDVDNLKDPVFIEISVDKADEDQTNQDCLMLLEKIQCDVDPSSLIFPEVVDQDVGSDSSSDVVDLGEKKEEPISLLTSSDEDEVIIQEPKIDTVEVSDETDEDDMPLVKLVDKRPRKSKKKKSTKSKKSAKTKSVSDTGDLANIMWGVYDYYCVQCHFKTMNRTEHKKHMAEHATVLQICQMCNYTTSSKAQFTRHKRKYHVEKKYKCSLCDYKAKHNMSLVYHLKTHDITVLKQNSLKDKKIWLKKTPMLHKCKYCDYETKRSGDLTRHVMRRHRPRWTSAHDEDVPEQD